MDHLLSVDCFGGYDETRCQDEIRGEERDSRPLIRAEVIRIVENEPARAQK